MNIPRNKWQDKLNDIWWGGFCSDTVEYCATTFEDPDGDAKRIAWTQKHINECVDCARAFLWKNVEGELARRLGPEAAELFQQGGNVFERYGEQATSTLDVMLRETKYPRQMAEFVERVSKRFGTPYYGRPGAAKGTWKC